MKLRAAYNEMQTRRRKIMNDKLITLKEHEEINRRQYEADYMLESGIKCPKCGEELLYDSLCLLLSDPPKRKTMCSSKECDYTGYMTA